MAGGVEWTEHGRKRGTEYQLYLSMEEQRASSTEREMIGVLGGLKMNAKELAGSSVRWMCDNWASAIINRVGSMRPNLQELAIQIWDLCRVHKINIEWEWRSRTTQEVKYADFLSKDMDFSDFCLSKRDFDRIDKMFGPFNCDYFASSITCRMCPFMSKYMCEGSSGVDAFSVEWRGNGYHHPPVDRIVDTVRYAKEQKAEGVLITPYWPASTFWAFLVLETEVDLVHRWRPFLHTPEFFKNRTFSGRPKFDFCVFKFRFEDN